MVQAGLEVCTERKLLRYTPISRLREMLLSE
jgi:hypothetical protein